MLDPSPQVRSSPFPAQADGITPQPFEIIEGDLDRGLILLCDHASNAIPDGYGTLGLPPDQFERHIAYDIGAAAVTRGLAARLGVPAILSKYSRLFIDLNRGADDPTLVMRLSDGAVIPGNRGADPTEITRRIEHYHAPYHQAVDRLIDHSIDAGIPPALLSVHSFTPRWKTTDRPWHITVLWDKDPRLPKPLLGALKDETDLCVDENEPYSGNLTGDCMYEHGTKRGLPHALIEIRQDLIANPEGQSAWVDRLSRIVDTLWTDAHLIANLREIQTDE